MNEFEFLNINVHSLGKFAFCPRAGVLAYEQQVLDKTDESDDEGTPRLDYLPMFDIELMNAALKTANKEQLKSGSVALALLMLILVFSSALSSVLFLLFVPLLLVFGRKAYLHWSDCQELTRRLKLEADSEASKLVSKNLGYRTINWWALSKDESFSSNMPEKPYADQELRLAGKPPRVARFEGRKIPVIFYHGELNEPKSYHRVRLSAYAVLIERNEVSAPVQWGIVLNPSTMKGIAVPIGETEKQEALEKLEEFRRELIDTRSGTDPVNPAPISCANCPHGRPQRYIRGKTDTLRYGKILKPRLHREGYGKSTHSACGDRFDWIPPHKLAIEKGLREA